MAALLAAWLPGAALPQDLDPTTEPDLVDVVEGLDGLDQPPTAAELEAEVAAAPAATVPPDGPGVEATARVDVSGDGTLRRDQRLVAGTGAWRVLGRWRSGADGADLVAGTGTSAAGTWQAWGGDLTWREGFGLVAGGAGRSSALAADGGLGPRTAGPRPWLGAPGDGTLRGAAMAAYAGGWAVGGAIGRTADGGQGCLLVVGRRSGRWRAVGVGGGAGPTRLGVTGSWDRGPWSGNWEAAWDAHTGPAAAVRWAVGQDRDWQGEALGIVAGDRRSSPWGGDLPLLGDGPGALAAGRLRWRPGPGSSLALLAAVAARDGTGIEPESRSVFDVLAAWPAGRGWNLEVRLRASERRTRRWSEQWPWAPPQQEPGRSTRSLGATCSRRTAGATWRISARHLAVDHAPTSGGRTLVGLDGSGAWGPSWRWRAGWRQAWGDPVDLADAFSPLPGTMVVRHWGQWHDGWHAACHRAAGAFRAGAALQFRRGSAGMEKRGWLQAGWCW